MIDPSDSSALAKAGIHPGRVLRMNAEAPRKSGRFVLYWMQASQRESCNHALEYAVMTANAEKLPLLAAFSLTDGYPGANLRHYAFMLDGLSETKMRLERRGIRLELLRGDPGIEIIKAAKGARILVADAGHTRIQRKWREGVAASCGCAAFEVETNLVVPVGCASDKEEYAARTIRPKLHRLMDEFMKTPSRQSLNTDSLGLNAGGIGFESPERLLASLDIDRTVKESSLLKGGEAEAERLLEEFIERKLADYGDMRNDPCEDGTSRMSAYLHFGQVSPVEIAFAAMRREPLESEPFIEELIVRRELSFNFVRNNARYDSFGCLPQWAVKALHEHIGDHRDAIYGESELEAAQSYDPAWNAAQIELSETGRMHGYMRMYWGKRIMEWMRTPEEAYATAVRLNDKYALDGRDPNGYAGVAWCFGKHDRPWAPGAIFGTVRRMTQSGLRRKFDLDAYIAKCQALRRSGK